MGPLQHRGPQIQRSITLWLINGSRWLSTGSISALKWCTSHQNPPIGHKDMQVQCCITCRVFHAKKSKIAYLCPQQTRLPLTVWFFWLTFSETSSHASTPRYRVCHPTPPGWGDILVGRHGFFKKNQWFSMKCVQYFKDSRNKMSPGLFKVWIFVFLTWKSSEEI